MITQRQQQIIRLLLLALGNAVLFWVIGLHYWFALPIPDHRFLALSQEFGILLFIVSTHLGYFGLWACLPLLLVLPLWTVGVRFKWLIGLMSVASVLIAGAFLIDGIIYNRYHYHFSQIFLQMILRDTQHQVFSPTLSEVVLSVSVFLGLCILQGVMIKMLLQRQITPRARRVALYGVLAIVFALCISILNYLLSTQQRVSFLPDEAVIFPYYQNMMAHMISGKHTLDHLERHSEAYLTVRKVLSHRALHYPLHPLTFAHSKTLPNILLLVIDSWRFDELNAHVTPHLFAFSQNTSAFTQHYSGGNCTLAGIFSLFYGIPSSYAQAALVERRAAPLMDELQKRGYQLGIFSSGTLRQQFFNKTIFTHVSPLRVDTPGETPYIRDQFVTDEFTDFIQHRDPGKPFFSFVFYDAAHGFSFPEDRPIPFKPYKKVVNRFLLNANTDPRPYRNRYRDALYYVDKHVNTVLTTLKQHHLLKHTIILITGDHGEEFNDNDQGYWGHTSNYTRSQVQVPFLLYWPGRQPKIYHHLSTHYDVSVTLLKDILRCKNPTLDYSIGQSLFSTHPRSYVIAGSYIDVGIIEPNQITRIYPSGRFQIQKTNAKPDLQGQAHEAIILQALADLRRYFK